MNYSPQVFPSFLRYAVGFLKKDMPTARRSGAIEKFQQHV